MPAPSSAEQLARSQTRLLFDTPSAWPHWPVLPVVRRPPGGGVECGLLYDARGHAGLYGYSATVFRANVFALPATVGALLRLPREVYDTLDELLDHGWGVDGLPAPK